MLGGTSSSMFPDPNKKLLNRGSPRLYAMKYMIVLANKNRWGVTIFSYENNEKMYKNKNTTDKEPNIINLVLQLLIFPVYLQR